ncbi:MAG: hypothetical protein ACXW2I_12500, partial [Burkholderiales bacterium]
HALALGETDASHHLPVSLHRARQPLHGTRLNEPGTGVTQLQAVQVELQALGMNRGHACDRSSALHPCLSRPLFTRWPARAQPMLKVPIPK